MDDTTDIDYTGEYISYFLYISSASHSRSLPEPGLRPFVEREDILRELKTLRFDDENIDVNESVSPASSIKAKTALTSSQRPHVAIVTKIDGVDLYYVKYLTPYQFSEINILKYLSKFNAPHVPGNMSYRKLEEGALLFIPYLGEHVERYEHLSRDLLSITQQILEGVLFLHSKCVAHLDLKPSHILVNNEGHVFIIDYDLSMRFKDPTETMSEYQGTKGYTAPEVGEGAYNPFLADIWSTGLIICDLLIGRRRHEATKFLDGLAERMMDEDPVKRLTLQAALREVTEYMTESSGASYSRN